MPGIIRQLTTFTKTEVEYLFAHARAVYKDAGITILCAPQQKSFGRALLITSRKVGNAPQRNKVRRQLKSIFYEQKIHEKGFDWAFITRKPILEKSFQELLDLCLHALKNAQAL